MAELRPLNNLEEQARQAVLTVQANDEEFHRNGAMDPQEDRERQEAAAAFLGENERHFVDYVEEFVRTSAEANRDIREIQQECWKVYQEEAPPNYGLKESWQSKVIIPKPHGAVQFAQAAVKQAFSTDFLTVEDQRNPKLARFWRKMLDIQYNRQHGQFVKRFTAGAGFGFATGQSLEFIPIWRPGEGLHLSLVEPWKIHRDPDALSQEPRSGLGWVHEEWQDLWALQEAERQGRYVNTKGLQTMSSAATSGSGQDQNPQNFQMDRHRIAQLRRQIWTRNRFRTSALTREYWGSVLDSQGNLLHPRLTTTIAADRVIGMPRPVPYESIPWPGTSFSPLPNFLRFEGRSLLQSVRSLWYYMCNLNALHIDYLNWQVNPMTEIEIQRMEDQDDLDPFPGKTYLVRTGLNGNPAVRTVDRRSNTNEVLANKQAADGDFQRGTFINDNIQGLPGFRQQVTARESAQNLRQSMTVFSIIGENLDVGAVDITDAVVETITLNITRPELLEMYDLEELIETFGESQDPIMKGIFEGRPVPSIFVPTPQELINRLGEIPQDITMSATGVKLPKPGGTFKVAGLQKLLKDQQALQAAQNLILPMSQNPMFAPFVKPHKIAKAIERLGALEDEGLLVDMEEAEAVDKRMKEQQAMQAEMQLQAFQQQQQLEQLRAELEIRKADSEAKKIEIEAQKVIFEVQKQEIEMRRSEAELEGELATLELELQKEAVAIEKQLLDLAKSEQEIIVTIVKTEADLRKVDSQIAKTQSQIELAERKAATEERIARAQINAMQANADGGEDDDG